ncbi:unnamed protein product [Allacma fusca]|uniref:Uncharacterized protein n=1 Tax=Allacma fusca TaxID=39272 RepID=A0A8J2LKN4_9HEXA|nr:unnamed protein product [Allacma fusca]
MRGLNSTWEKGEPGLKSSRGRQSKHGNSLSSTTQLRIEDLRSPLLAIRPLAKNPSHHKKNYDNDKSLFFRNTLIRVSGQVDTNKKNWGPLQNLRRNTAIFTLYTIQQGQSQKFRTVIVCVWKESRKNC